MRSTWAPGSPRLPTSIGVAVLAHGALLLSGSYQRTYDAYVHLFFADHYARDWFSTWETRWYTGFTVTSYPPGTHQLMGLLSKVVGLQAAFVIVQMAAIVVLVVGVHRFSRLWVSRDAANWAALLAGLSTAIAEAVHVFGQLPTTMALGLLLNAMPSIDRWLRDGRRRSLLVGIATVAATTACHHVTTLFGSVFFLGPVVARVVLDDLNRPLADEPTGHPAEMRAGLLWPLVARRVRRILPTTWRVGLLGGLMLTALVAVVLPYWLWSSSDPIVQVPIPHGSRANFLAEPNIGLVFWIIPWGPLLVVLPALLMRGIASKAWPLTASVALLTLLGTGGTTPIPRLLLGGAFDILTLDRFTFWATIAVLPLAGRLLVSLTDGRLGELLANRIGPVLYRGALGMTALAVVAGFLFSASFGRFRSLQPDPIDPAPVAEFLAKDQHDRWRYLTLGFGDQVAWVSAHTTATTVDGNYHSARRLPELTSRPVERLEGAKFRGVPGVGSLQQFLTTPQRYNLKFVFSNDTFYDPLLFASGWQRLGSLRNNVIVWERADVPPLPATLPVRELPTWQRLLWGLLPLTAIVSAAFTQAWNLRGERIPARLRVVIGHRRPAAGSRIASYPQRWLLAPARRVDGGNAEPLDWVGRHRLAALRDRIERAPRPGGSRRLGTIVAGVIVLAMVAVTGALTTTSTTNPADQVYDFYDDLDFRRFESAWARLDPTVRVSLDQFLLDRSVEDGLVASYAKLDRIETTAVRIDGRRAEVDVALRYLTSVEEYDVDRTHLLVQRDGRWFLSPDERDEAVPPSQFVRQTAVDYLDLGRREQTVEITDYNDVLDRPRVEILDSTLVRRAGRWHIVGQLTNVDVDPADITVTGRLIDADRRVLAAYDGGQATVHKVRPGETVPFRIDFEGVAGANDAAAPDAGDFAPDSVTEVILDAPVASYDLAVKALVTGRDLERLTVENLDYADGTLGGRLRNDLTTSATVPLVTVAQLDELGAVRWVDLHYLPVGIRPQRSDSFAMALTDLSTIEVIDVPSVRYDNGRTDQVDTAFSGPPTLAITTRPPFAADEPASLRVTARTFLRELAP